MTSTAIKSLIICAFGVAAITGCASSPSSPSAPAVASTQEGVRSGKVAAVESVALVDKTTIGSSSGSSTTTTTIKEIRGGPSLITVSFDDGKQDRFVIENPDATYAVGDPVYVITDRDRTAIMARE